VNQRCEQVLARTRFAAYQERGAVRSGTPDLRQQIDRNRVSGDPCGQDALHCGGHRCRCGRRCTQLLRLRDLAAVAARGREVRFTAGFFAAFATVTFFAGLDGFAIRSDGCRFFADFHNRSRS
jgi:hypothetical protein